MPILMSLSMYSTVVLSILSFVALVFVIRWVRVPGKIWFALALSLIGSAQMYFGITQLVLFYSLNPDVQEFIFDDLRPLASFVQMLPMAGTSFMLVGAIRLGGALRHGVVREREASVGDGGEPVEALPIGGWLILPAIGMILGPVLGLISLIAALALFDRVQRAGLGGLFAFEIVVDVLVLSYAIVVAVMFYRKKRVVPVLIVVMLGANIVIAGVLMGIELGMDAERFALQSARQLVGGVIAGAIWIPYFLVSKRVKATFVR
ncbi:MAG: DUF2569 domain-containing protein [Phycisphaerales bacterium JB043]